MVACSDIHHRDLYSAVIQGNTNDAISGDIENILTLMHNNPNIPNDPRTIICEKDKDEVKVCIYAGQMTDILVLAMGWTTSDQGFTINYDYSHADDKSAEDAIKPIMDDVRQRLAELDLY